MFKDGQNKIPENLDEAFKLAIDARAETESFCQFIVDAVNKKFGKESSKSEFNLKEYQRAKEKLDNKYDGDVSKLEDIARCRITCNSLEQIDYLKDLVTKNTNPYRVEDTMERPNSRGYRDLKYTFVAENGSKVEMQVNIKEYVQAGKVTHPFYEEIRDITEKAKQRELTTTEQEKITFLQNNCKKAYSKAMKDYNERTTGRKLVNATSFGIRKGRDM